LIFLPLAVCLFAQQRPITPFFDASVRCVPGPNSPDCAVPEEHITFRPRPVAPSVSVYRLAHKVPAKARKAWNRAVDAAVGGRPQETVALLDEAIAHDGEFADALHMRGLFAFQAKDFPRAAELLDRAAKLDNANPGFLADAAVGQLRVRNPVVAERHARAALRLNPLQSRALEVLNNLKP
jgi:Flp pilus assembly protein TadD